MSDLYCKPRLVSHFIYPDKLRVGIYGIISYLLLPGVSPAACESDSLRAEVSRDNDASLESDCFDTGDLLGVGLDKGL